MKKYLVNISYILGIIAFLLCYACAEDYYDLNSKQLPVEIKSSSNRQAVESLISYSYNAENRLTQIIEERYLTEEKSTYKIKYKLNYTDFGNIAGLTRTYYNENDNVMLTDTLDFIYNVTTIAVKSENLKNDTIEINTNGDILKYIRYLGETDTIPEVHTYEYDKNGNIISHITAYSWGANIVRKQNYDNRNGIFKDVNMPQWFIVSQLQDTYNLANNCEQETVVYDANSEINYNIIYEYDKKGYPLFQTTYPGDGLPTDIQSIEIKYKNVY